MCTHTHTYTHTHAHHMHMHMHVFVCVCVCVRVSVEGFLYVLHVRAFVSVPPEEIGTWGGSLIFIKFDG